MPGYLGSVSGPDLLRAFEEVVCDKDGFLSEEGALASLPEACFVDALRWGTPCTANGSLGTAVPRTERQHAGSCRASRTNSLAPTQDEECGASRSFV
mmetsp:Transcript_7431/g.17122  ORF Transcript_7431/g.17122 Transcript_7431/m.17122 type:complete len:97 (-) Transcript_7431:149-439(-)